jgi:hypothetical protein
MNPVAGTTDERRLFLIALAAVSLLPVLSLTVARVTALPGLSDFNFGIAFLATGFHVALTSFFYVDPELRELRRAHPARFVWVPVALCVGTAVVLVSFGSALPWVLIGYFAWQLYHFQRQNVGVLAFVSSSLKVARPTRLEHIAVELAAYAGVLGFLALDGVEQRTVGDFSGTLYSMGLVAQLFAASLALAGGLLRIRREGWSWFVPWHFLCTIFFAGTFLVHDGGFAFATYAYAHGLQYVIFMYLLSFSRGRRLPRLSPFALTLAGVAGAILLAVISNRVLFNWTRDAVFGVYLGLVMSHFVVDAIVWRLSEPTQRSYVRRSFAFVWE